MSTERLISVITDLEKAVKELTMTIKESNRIAMEEMAFVTSEEFTENLSRVVDSALDEAAVGRDMLGGE